MFFLVQFAKCSKDALFFRISNCSTRFVLCRKQGAISILSFSEDIMSLLTCIHVVIFLRGEIFVNGFC